MIHTNSCLHENLVHAFPDIDFDRVLGDSPSQVVTLGRAVVANTLEMLSASQTLRYWCNSGGLMEWIVQSKFNVACLFF